MLGFVAKSKLDSIRLIGESFFHKRTLKPKPLCGVPMCNGGFKVCHRESGLDTNQPRVVSDRIASQHDQVLSGEVFKSAQWV